MPNSTVPAAAEGMPTLSRRAVLAGLGSLAAPSAAIAVTVNVDSQPTPEQRIEAAIAEIEAAMLELNPGWHVQMRNDVMHSRQYVQGGPDIERPYSHAVVVYASRRPRGHEEVRWFVNDKSPLLADDVTGTTAFADWEARS